MSSTRFVTLATRACRYAAFLLALVAGFGLLPSAAAQSCTTELISARWDKDNRAPNASQATITPDGRYVAFVSENTDLVPGNLVTTRNVFVLDRFTDGIDLVSVNVAGESADASCSAPSISNDGRYVAFQTPATNLVPGAPPSISQVYVADRVTRNIVLASQNFGTFGNAFSGSPSISGDGRYIAFETQASNLLPFDSNFDADVYRFDRLTGEIVRVSNGCSSTAAVGGNDPTISNDGRYVAFTSSANNAACSPVKTDFVRDVYIRDMQTNTTFTASTNASGLFVRPAPLSFDLSGSPRISADGRFVAFRSKQRLVGTGPKDAFSDDVFRKDRITGAIVRVNEPGLGLADNAFRQALRPSISSDARYVTFESSDAFLVPGNTVIVNSLYRRDLATLNTIRLSASSSGFPIAVNTDFDDPRKQIMSFSGALVLFSTVESADTFDRNTSRDAYLRDLNINRTALAVRSIARSTGGRASSAPSISGDGRFVVFYSQSTDLGSNTIFGGIQIRDRVNQSTSMISESKATSATAMSRDARYVAFETDEPFQLGNQFIDDNAVKDIYVYDRTNRSYARASIGAAGVDADGPSGFPDISDNGRFVVFESAARNLVGSDTNGRWDVFRKDMTNNSIRRLSRSTAGTQGNDDSLDVDISGNGLFAAFVSFGSNLVSGDTNGLPDVFFHDTTTNSTVRVQRTGVQPNGASFSPSVSSDGNRIVFESDATNLTGAPDGNNATDIFVWDRTLNQIFRVSQLTGGADANAGSFLPTISADGTTVVFESLASNLVAGDTPNTLDVFSVNIASLRITRLTVDSSGLFANGDSWSATVNQDGLVAAFTSAATNLVPDDTNRVADVFVRTRGCELFCAADVNRDGVVDLIDFFDFFQCFDTTNPCADIDGEAGVDLGDFFLFFQSFDTGC